jgi:Predicted transcriptional regulators
MDYKVLGNKIRYERLAAKLTQAELAEKVNVSTAYIGQIERGERKFSIETLLNISDVLNTSVDNLLLNNYKSSQKPIIHELTLLLESSNNADALLALDIVKSVFERLKKH